VPTFGVTSFKTNMFEQAPKIRVTVVLSFKLALITFAMIFVTTALPEVKTEFDEQLKSEAKKLEV